MQKWNKKVEKNVEQNEVRNGSWLLTFFLCGDLLALALMYKAGDFFAWFTVYAYYGGEIIVEFVWLIRFIGDGISWKYMTSRNFIYSQDR